MNYKGILRIGKFAFLIWKTLQMKQMWRGELPRGYDNTTIIRSEGNLWPYFTGSCRLFGHLCTCCWKQPIRGHTPRHSVAVQQKQAARDQSVYLPVTASYRQEEYGYPQHLVQHLSSVIKKQTNTKPAEQFLHYFPLLFLLESLTNWHLRSAVVVLAPPCLQTASLPLITAVNMYHRANIYIANEDWLHLGWVYPVLLSPR